MIKAGPIVFGGDVSEGSVVSNDVKTGGVTVWRAVVVVVGKEGAGKEWVAWWRRLWNKSWKLPKLCWEARSMALEMVPGECMPDISY